jgi:hypothetical protein
MNQTANSPPAALARRENLVVREMLDEVLVYNLRQHKAHCLNRAAAFVWNHCDGQTTAAEIARLMEQEWRKPISEDVVRLALKQLHKADLLQEPVIRVGVESRVSRREVMRKLGTAAAVALPLVTSIIAPTAASAATIPAACQDCVKKQDGVGACPSVCGPDVIGTCYDNSGCGSGQSCGPSTCAACFSGTVCPPPPGMSPLTVSWSAPT